LREVIKANPDRQYCLAVLTGYARLKISAQPPLQTLIALGLLDA